MYIREAFHFIDMRVTVNDSTAQNIDTLIMKKKMRGSLNMKCNMEETVVTLKKPCAPCEHAVVGKWGARIILPIPSHGMRAR